jgi:hypothetical protein
MPPTLSESAQYILIAAKSEDAKRQSLSESLGEGSARLAKFTVSGITGQVPITSQNGLRGNWPESCEDGLGPFTFWLARRSQVDCGLVAKKLRLCDWRRFGTLEILEAREHRFDVNHRRAVNGFNGTDAQPVFGNPPHGYAVKTQRIGSVR